MANNPEKRNVLTNEERRMVETAQWIGWNARIYLENHAKELMKEPAEKVYGICLKQAQDDMLSAFTGKE